MGEQRTWQDVLDANATRNLDDLVELLRIPSVSADPGMTDEVVRAAEWAAARLTRGGLEHVAVMPAGRHPAVYADWLHAPGRPTLLIYGHLDVQPADPLELWTAPPFEPTIEDGQIRARGAADMKANVLLTIAAVEAVLEATGALPVNVKFILEGQEEIGSPDLGPFVTAHRDLLACDIVLTPDGGQWSEDQPAALLGTKGICVLQIDVETAAMDLHSGMYGGAVPNANHALVALLATLRAADGLILVDGFYDQVVPLSPDDRAEIGRVPFDEAAYKAEIGVDALVGEPGYSTYERAGARPTLEINGLWGGYQGEGVKTVVPNQAHAKITCRLVANQEPDDVLDRLEDHLRRHAPPGARVTTRRLGGKARPYLMPADNPGLKVVADVLEEVYQRPPYYVRTGGTLPIMDMFLQDLGAYTAVVGFGRDDERIHSPNEFFRLRDYGLGMVVYARLLERFASVDPASLAVRRP